MWKIVLFSNETTSHFSNHGKKITLLKQYIGREDEISARINGAHSLTVD